MNVESTRSQPMYRQYAERFGEVPNFGGVTDKNVLVRALHRLQKQLDKKPNHYSLSSFSVVLFTLYLSKYSFDKQESSEEYDQVKSYAENLAWINESTTDYLLQAKKALLTRALGRRVMALSESVFLPVGATLEEMREVVDLALPLIREENSRPPSKESCFRSLTP